MFTLAIILGVFSYVIFFLGVFHLLFTVSVLPTIFLLICLLVFLAYKSSKKIELKTILQENKFFFLLLFLFVLQAAVNLIGAFGPETAFDALWYHATLPKLSMITHMLFYGGNGLFYYAYMPKLGEMIYTAALFVGPEEITKVIHFSFGLLTCLAMYKLARKFTNRTFSLLSVVLFYSNLVVAWESTTAYIDLIRTFYELLAVLALITWKENKKNVWLILSAICIGLAITTKLLAIGTLVILLILLVKIAISNKIRYSTTLIYSLLYLCIAIVTPSPWFVFSFIHTGNPLFPFFSPVYPTHLSIGLLNPITFVSDTWNLFTRADDPISPIFIIILPLVLLHMRILYKKYSFFIAFSALAIVIWYITPQTGGGRFIIPFLPVFSILSILVITELKDKTIKMFLIFLIVLSISISIIYRGIATSKYIPVLLGRESKAQFLSNHLNFSFGDFYDTDGFFMKNIKSTDKVLLVGFHNLYYVNFPFTFSFQDKNFNYIATQNTILPKQFTNFKKIYSNPKTGVNVYKMH